MSLGGSSPFTSTDITKKKIYTLTKQYKNAEQTIQKHSKYKYTYYQNIHTLQNKLNQPQYKIHTK